MKKICIYIVILTIAIMLFMTDVLGVSACTHCGWSDDNGSYKITYHFTQEYTGYGGHRCYWFQVDDCDDFLYDFDLYVNNRRYIVLRSAVPFTCGNGIQNGSNMACTWSGSYNGSGNEYYFSLELPNDFIDWEFDENYQSYKPLNELSVSSWQEFMALSLDDFTPSFAPDGSRWEGPSYDDPTVSYDFTLDVFNKNIPIPECYNIGFDRLWIKNSNGYALDFVVETTVYELGMKESGNTPCYGSTNNVFRSNHFNFTISNKAYLHSGACVFKDMYDVDIAQWYEDSMVAWLDRYPTVKDLDGYSWSRNMNGYNTTFYNKWVGNYESRKASYDGDILKAVSVALPMKTTYYVRFVSLADASYGQWKKYSVSNKGIIDKVGGDSAPGVPSDIEESVVEGVSSSGKPITSPSSTVYYDKELEEYVAKPEYEVGSVDWSVSLSNLRQVTSLFGSFPSFVAVCFSFLPEWITALIGATITVVCALALYHAIRG